MVLMNFLIFFFENLEAITEKQGAKGHLGDGENISEQKSRMHDGYCWLLYREIQIRLTSEDLSFTGRNENSKPLIAVKPC